MSICELDKQYVSNTYNRFPVTIVSGKGSVVYDEAGKEYIDLGSGIGVTAFGVADELWQKAVTEQIGKVQHMSNLYYTEPCAKLAKTLCERTGMKKVFFCNSGAESNECLIKAARKYGFEKRGADCYEVVTLVNSFHGRTITTLAATGQDVFHEQFKPLTAGFRHIAANDIAAIETIDPKKTCAVLFECVQGEGGVNALDREFVLALDAFCKKNDVLLCVDEVQTGNGRSGALYAYMNFGIEPDLVSTAKGLAGGLPIGATLFGAKTENIFAYSDHGSTFGGNPVSCAAALSVIDRIDDKLLAEVREKSEYVFKTLTGAKGVESVSGMGLMIGIKTEKPAKELVAKLIEDGILCLTAKDKLRLLPALNIPFDTLKKAVDRIKAACAE
ncbi:MAG: acetylornithine/succinylornithine family transaminase [Oscillospiraceae bacterium]|nr:acetylornithine/succinylornithine family transaminase [Oscillospiraceae bacterium]MBR3849737.1 acetylornithine/succinylornithine family transaminase [Oscillospiraceae bacterium]